MKRTAGLAVVIAMCVGVASSYAFIGILWTSESVIMEYGVTEAQYTLDPSLGIDAGSLIQLIWSADNIMDPIALDGSPTGNDQVLDSDGAVTKGAYEGWIDGHDSDQYEYTDLVGLADNDELVSGYVYIRAFNQPSGSIGVGTHYVQGALTGGPLFDSPGDPSAFDVADITSDGPIALDMTIVPEPGTFALFGLGIATLAMRRRFRK